MTVKQLRKLIKFLPSDMEVLIPQAGGILISACNKQTSIAEIETEDAIEEVLLIVPCTCNEEAYAVNPELN